MRPAASPVVVWAGIVVLYLVWGSTYLAISLAVETLPPFTMSCLRFVPAGLVLVAATLLRHRRTIRRPSRVELRDSAIVGACLTVGGVGLVSWGEQTIPSGVAALLIALMPMWLAVFARLLFGVRLPVPVLAGIAVGIAGVAVLAWPSGDVGDLDPAGLAALLASPMFWAAGSLYAARRAVLPSPGLFATGIQLLAGGIIFLGLAIATGELAGFDVAAVSTRSWAGVLYLLTVGSLVGYATYAWLLTVAPLPRIATYAYVNPVVAVVLGALLAGEPLTARTVLAAAMIVGAVALIVTARARSETRGPTRLEVPAPVAEPATGS